MMSCYKMQELVSPPPPCSCSWRTRPPWTAPRGARRAWRRPRCSPDWTRPLRLKKNRFSVTESKFDPDSPLFWESTRPYQGPTISQKNSCVKVDSLNPKCNQLGCMKPLRQKLTPPMLVAFRIEGVNFETTGFIWQFKESGFMQPCWLHLGLKESTLATVFWPDGATCVIF